MSQIAALTEENSDERVTIAALFTEFLKVSLCSFGGGLVWARRAVVEQRHWMSEHEFADTLSLCQFLPGPNVIGIAVCVGAKLRGAIGALAALSGFVLIPCAVGFALGALYLQSAKLPVVQNTLGGASAVAAGLLIATGVSLYRLRSRANSRSRSRSAVGGYAVSVRQNLLRNISNLALFSI